MLLDFIFIHHLILFFVQNHINRTTTNRKLNLGNSKSNSKLAYVELQEELISAKVRETKMKATNIEFKQRLLELETSVRIFFFLFHPVVTPEKSRLFNKNNRTVNSCMSGLLRYPEDYRRILQCPNMPSCLQTNFKQHFWQILKAENIYSSKFSFELLSLFSRCRHMFLNRQSYA